MRLMISTKSTNLHDLDLMTFILLIRRIWYKMVQLKSASHKKPSKTQHERMKEKKTKNT